MKILSVVGARPQFVKLAPMAAALGDRADHVIVHTGQHYDPAMSQVFFDDLGIPRPDHSLDIGSDTHGRQTGAMMAALESVFEVERPDAVLAYGDTNSTLAAAVTAVKMRTRLHHLEAGLRSFNRAMPEEHNRILTDHAADLCLAPTTTAMAHLAAEGLQSRSVLVGDVMTDIVFATRDRVATTPLPAHIPVADGQYYVGTLHRPQNTDDSVRLASIFDAFAALDRPVVLLMHPRLAERLCALGLERRSPRIIPAPPAPYPELVRLILGSRGVVTDSGGLQKEAFLLRRPCVTVRTETEWNETVDLGWNVLTGDAVAEIAHLMSGLAPRSTDAAPYGDGRAAEAAVDAIVRDLA